MLIESSISAALLLAAAPAPATDPEGASEVVSFADLNLATPAGITQLDRRIGRAVRRVSAARIRETSTRAFRSVECQVSTYRSIAARRGAALAAASAPRDRLLAARITR